MLRLNKLGARVGLFDADLYGPSIPILSKISPKISKNKR